MSKGDSVSSKSRRSRSKRLSRLSTALRLESEGLFVERERLCRNERLGIAPLALPWVGDESPPAETLDEQGVGSMRTATRPSDAADTSPPATGSPSATTSASSAVETIVEEQKPLAPSDAGSERLSVRVRWMAVAVALLVVFGLIAVSLAHR